MKNYADSKQYVRPDNLNIGDSALVQKDPSYKKGVPYNETPFVVTSKKGSMVTVSDGSQNITRNSSFFKQIPDNIVVSADPDLEADTDTYIEDVPPSVAMDAPKTVVMDTASQSTFATPMRYPHSLVPRQLAQPTPVKSPVVMSGTREDVHPRRERKPPVRFKDYEHYKVSNE